MKKISGKILVTGADGFIGSHLVEALISEDCDVRALVFYNSFNSWGWLDTICEDYKKELEVVAGDIRDPFGVRKIIEGCDVVLNLAALISIPFSYRSPSTYIDTNIKGALNVLQAAHELGVKKVIQTSTSEVYGTAQFVPITEKHPLQGQSPYSASKIGADQLAMSYFYSYGTPISIIRPFNTFGPRQSMRAVIPTIIAQIASGQKKIKLGSLTPTRDFNYVSDIVQGFILAAKSEQCIGQAINLGSNFEVSIGETVQLISEIMKVQVETEQEGQRVRPEKSEVERLWACNLKAKQILNWTPVYGGRAGFVKGLEETIAWFSNEDNLRSYKSNIYNI
ncbi:MAG TPA: SDR family NAD(P)-dependent oxidoreductase [Nitrospinaceae bacterium]|jgi:dTDP-glucose 4,6-dehydratase|nr:SDR family NAD(P)-dependent oxidoreductase [Nitrospinaceae bacterium]